PRRPRGGPGSEPGRWSAWLQRTVEPGRTGASRRPPPTTNPAETSRDNGLRTRGTTMAERRVTIGWAEGLHARPASIFVRAATAAGVPLTIAKGDGAPVNAASLLAVLSLGAVRGDEVVLRTGDGVDA